MLPITGLKALTNKLLCHSLAPGGTRIDESDKTKVTAYCVFTTEESHAALRLYAQVESESEFISEHDICKKFILVFCVEQQ